MTLPVFEILNVRSVGAYATVCRARRRDDPLRRDCAVKVIRSALIGNARALTRTRDEARLLAKLNHPNIVRVEDLLSYDRRPVLVMEWLDGLSLRELLERHRSGLDAKVVLAPLLAADDDEGDDDGRHERRGGMWASDAVDFFNAFYHALYVVGADAVAALGAAALVQPSCHRFRCHMKINGEILSLKAGDDDLLPDEEEY